MENIKRIHPPSFKAKVTLELVREDEKMSVVCSRYGIHPTQAGKWKQQFLSNAPQLFADKSSSELRVKDAVIDELYKQIGQLKVELDWLKKMTVRLQKKK